MNFTRITIRSSGCAVEGTDDRSGGTSWQRGRGHSAGSSVPFPSQTPTGSLTRARHTAAWETLFKKSKGATL